jgi:hypothetical protein
MRDDQVVWQIFRRFCGSAFGAPASGVGHLGANAAGVWAGAADEGLEQGWTGVDGVDLDGGICLEQPGSEAPVAITQDDGAAAGEQVSQESAAAPPEPGAEADQFHPAIEAGEAVEVWLMAHRK